jgi:hypothetical protein
VRLFSAAGDAVCLIPDISFAQDHSEADLQGWADRNPSLLNDGQPMISLGREVGTRHGQSVDNMFIDGNGTVVAVELKRGKSPREVVAQMLDYAAYASRLNWEDVDLLCQKRHRGVDLSQNFTDTFGIPLHRASKPDHRLVIAAEKFDPTVTDAALYLINERALPLVLIEFQWFRLGEQSILHVAPVLGEIPKQSDKKQLASEANEIVDDGYAAWFLKSIAHELDNLGREQGWALKFRIGKQTLPFNSADWPLGFGDCQFRVDLYKRNVISLRFSFRRTVAPGLEMLLESKKKEWMTAFPAHFERSIYETKFATVTRELPPPVMGDTVQLNSIMRAIAQMAEALRPLVDEYFATEFKQHAGASEQAGLLPSGTQT